MTEHDIPTPSSAPEPPHRPHKRRRGERILRSTAALPALCTLLNGLSGFGSLHYATKEAATVADRLHNLETAAWLIFLAMFFDMLDGRLARMTRRTSDFGAQLDSLSDAVSFGVAPAMLMVRTVVLALQGKVEKINFLPDFLLLERVIWCVAAIYVACALLRLARFNVESTPDEAAHMDFRGLPSPGAAAAVAALVLLFVRLATHYGITGASLLTQPWALALVAIILPIFTLATALLMVSRFRYPHVVNQYIRGKKPFSYLVKGVVILGAAVLEPYVTMAAVTLAFALSGLVGWGWRTLWNKPAPPHAKANLKP